MMPTARSVAPSFVSVLQYFNQELYDDVAVTCLDGINEHWFRKQVR